MEIFVFFVQYASIARAKTPASVLLPVEFHSHAHV